MQTLTVTNKTHKDATDYLDPFLLFSALKETK